MIDRKIKLSFIAIFLMAAQTVLAVEIKVSLDRNPISLNESVQLTYTASQAPDGEPDFTPLEKDFDILNQSKRSNSSWVNGRSTKTIQWILNIMPKRSGEIYIPTISFGDDNSQTSKLLVQDSTPATSHSTDELFLQATVSSDAPYLQSQVLYTLKLYSRVDLAQARLSELELEDALVEKLGDVKKYNTQHNGIEYTVNELNYAIFPQKSGMLKIEPMVLTAEVISHRQPRFNGFFSRQMSKTKRVLSNAIDLNVLAVPESFQGSNWLPARHVRIEENWSGDTAEMKVGEPLTRTLTVLTIGNTVAQLPELYRDNGEPLLKTYPDQPVLKEQKQDKGIISFREEKIAYIPSKAGSYTLPAIEILWFNTETQSMEVASIAERTVTAIAIAGQVPLQPLTAIQDETLQQPAPSVSQPSPQVGVVENKFWMWLAFVLAAGWLLTLIFVFARRKPPEPQVDVENEQEINLKQAVRALKQACAENNALSAKNALLSWGKMQYGSASLSAIAPHCEARLRDQINHLNQHLYASQPGAWEGKQLFQSFTEHKARTRVAKKKDEALEPLYRL